MITGLMKNNFTQKLATGAAALGVLAGVGLASSPAEALTFRINGGLPEAHESVPTGNIFPVNTLGWDSHPCYAGDLSGCIPGTTPDVPVTVLITGNPNERARLRVDYIGDDAAATNLFDLDSIKWSTGPASGYTNVGDGKYPECTGDPDSCWLPPFPTTAYLDITLDSSGQYKIPFKFTSLGTGTTPINSIENGAFCAPGNLDCHFFAAIYPFTIGNVPGDTPPREGNMVGVGFGDRPLPGDDDTQDFVVKFSVETVPEPGTVLGLLAVGGLGALMKRKKQG